MPVNTVIAGPALTAGLRAEFKDTYKRKYQALLPRLGKVMQLGVPSDKLTELYAYFESAPHPRRWIRGENISVRNFRAVQYTVTNHDWARQIQWHVNDRQDDQIKSLVEQARQLGESFAMLHERIFFQMLTATADAELLPAVPNAPDGAALFATVAAGAARFGAASGNLLTGTGVATAAAVRADFFTSMEQFRLFQDTETQPLWDDATVDQGAVVIYGAANDQVFREAFQQAITHQLTGGTAAGVTNVVLDAGHKVTLWPTQRITNNDFFVFLEGSSQKAIFQQERQGLQDHSATMENSDLARDTKVESQSWEARYGYGINIPYQAIRVSN